MNKSTLAVARSLRKSGFLSTDSSLRIPANGSSKSNGDPSPPVYALPPCEQPCKLDDYATNLRNARTDLERAQCALAAYRARGIDRTSVTSLAAERKLMDEAQRAGNRFQRALQSWFEMKGGS